MRRIRWRDALGTTTWRRAPGLWSGLYEQCAARSGVYASARGEMVSFVLEGRMHVQLGPRAHGLEVRAGDVMGIGARTPFSYCLEPGTRLLILDAPGRAGRGLALTRLPARRLPRRAAAALAGLDRGGEGALRALASEVGRLGGDALFMAPVQSTRRVLEVKGQLDAGFMRPVQVSKLAADKGMSLSYLSRSFRRTVGVSPQAYLQHLRYERFLHLVLERRAPLGHLSEAAGFSDYPTFCRYMKKRLGVPPSRLAEDGQTCPSRAASAG